MEWKIWCREHKLAGTIDLIAKKEDGTYAIYDWKRTKHCIRKEEDNWGRTGCFPITHVYDNRYFRYALQLNMYRKILQDNYNGYKVSSLYTVRFHPNAVYKSFELVEMEIMEREVELILHHRIQYGSK